MKRLPTPALAAPALASVALGAMIAAGAALGTGAAHAADLAPAPYGALSAPARPAPFFSEVRLGVFAHDPASPESGGADLNGEVLFAPFGWDRTSPWGWLTPRVHVGGTASFNNKTSQVYAGFTWTYDLTPSIFLEGAFGGAFHNGKTGLIPPPGFNAMGCPVAFHESASLGYRFTPQWSVMATVEHTSNSGLCKQNRGLTNVGLRAAYTF